jgi:hypothetical protein
MNVIEAFLVQLQRAPRMDSSCELKMTRQFLIDIRSSQVCLRNSAWTTLSAQNDCRRQIEPDRPAGAGVHEGGAQICSKLESPAPRPGV